MTFSDYMDYLRGKRIGVIGFGVSNQPLVRVLLRNGCDVTVHRIQWQLHHEAVQILR